MMHNDRLGGHDPGPSAVALKRAGFCGLTFGTANLFGPAKSL